MKYIDWTDERVAELTRLWANGLSAARIAEVMGLRSRNMVVGKVNRLALPKPEKKLPVVIDYTKQRRLRQCPDITRAKANAYKRAYMKKWRAKRMFDVSTKQGVRAMMLARGTSKTSAAYRKHLPPMPEMSKAEMRAMLAQAMQNTVSP